MNATPPALPSAIKRRQPMSRGLLICLIILGIFAALIAWHIVWRISNARAVARLEKAARDRGEPVTLAELAATYPEIPDASNAYTALEKVWLSEEPEFWGAFKGGESSLPEQKSSGITRELPYFNLAMSHTNTLDPDTMQKVQTFLATNDSHMGRVREALSRSDFRARIKIEDGFARCCRISAR